ncbi:DUF7691 family protein [Nocardia australiensis]|uniref:DUF7691 family protein n=1 Tax=Nocardia australiensis TaxID=2887191 RepID=UPI001D149440|nr:hypothetical protein [Nocardia australiensis]
MGYYLNLYLVDLDAVDAMVGSGDQSHIDRIAGECAEELAASDGSCADRIAAGAPTAAEALATVIEGGPFEHRYANDYLDAYESICSVIGVDLDTVWGPFEFDWPARVDKGLTALGIRVGVRMFAGTRLPGGLPDSNHAGFGSWTEQDCLDALQQWEATRPEQRAELDPDVLEGIEDCVAWMREVKRFPGARIAGFWG